MKVICKYCSGNGYRRIWKDQYEKEKITIISTDGTTRVYVVVDDNATTVATGAVLAADSDTGASTAGSALVGGIAVAINLTGSAATQNAFLVQLKAAIADF